LTFSDATAEISDQLLSIQIRKLFTALTSTGWVRMTIIKHLDTVHCLSSALAVIKFQLLQSFPLKLIRERLELNLGQLGGKRKCYLGALIEIKLVTSLTWKGRRRMTPRTPGSRGCPCLRGRRAGRGFRRASWGSSSSGRPAGRTCRIVDR